MTDLNPKILIAIIMSLVLIGSSSAQVDDQKVRRMLASELTRAAYATLASEPLTVEAIQASLVMIEEATGLNPDEVKLWRLKLKLAALSERDDLVQEAMNRLAKLVPEDPAILLLRLEEAVDRFQTVQQRIDAYQKLLAPDARDQLGPIVSSRLALDLALLYQQAGDVDSFSRWLAESTIIDPAHREAAGIASVFFAQQSDDPYAQAELLCNQLLSNPIDLSTMVELGSLLVAYGAYDGADRINTLLQECAKVEEIWLDNDLIVSLALGKWARGQAEDGVKLIDERLEQLKAEDQLAVEQASGLRINEEASLQLPRYPSLEFAAAAIRNRMNPATGAAACARAIEAYQWLISQSEELGLENADLARIHLDMAWIELWLDGDSDHAAVALARAGELEELTDAARLRFQGWLALRAGEPERAADIFLPLVEDDPIADLGLALIRLNQDRKRDAARSLLRIVRTQPGTLMGVWAGDQLMSLLGQRVAISELATRLNELIATIPFQIDRYPSNPTTALSIRLIPVKRTFGPYEPVLVDIEITSHAVVPLGVSPDGPIRPQIVLLSSVVSMTRDQKPPLPPIVLDIDGVLNLQPRERHIQRIDLREYEAGERLGASPLDGSSISLKAILNFYARADGMLKPGLLGSSGSASAIRVDGVRVSDQWLADTTKLIALDQATYSDLALMCHAITRGPAPEAAAERAKLFEDARSAVLTAFPRLDPVAQAWIIATLPVGADFEPILNETRKSEHRLLKMAYLLFQRQGDDDPMLDAAMRGDDDAVRAIAEMIRSQQEANDGEDVDASTQPEDR